MSDQRLQLAIFRLSGVCVQVQEDLTGYPHTAGLQRDPRIEAVFRWLRKRQVRIALLSDWDREATDTLLQRIGWAVGEEQLISAVVVQQQECSNPLLSACESLGYRNGRLGIALVDSPRLLDCAREAGLYLSLAYTGGHYSYAELGTHPHHALLDAPVQLVELLLETLLAPDEAPPERQPWRQRLPFPLLRLPRVQF